MPDIIGVPTAPAFLLGGDLPVHRLGFGAMRLTGQPGNFGRYPDWEAGKALLRQAAELGVDFFDTARAYGPGHNEDLVADALHPYRPGLVVATKGGIEKASADGVRPDGRPEALRRHAEESLRRLRLDALPLFYLHRPDPAVPWADQVGALRDLRDDGLIRHVGLSNVSLDRLREALAVVPVAAVQNRYGLLDRASDSVLETCRAEGIAFVPWGPLGADPMRPGAPVATAAEGALAEVAAALGATTTQVALAWLLHRAPNVLLIPGTTSPAHLAENAAAAGLRLSPERRKRLDGIGAANRAA